MPKSPCQNLRNRKAVRLSLAYSLGFLAISVHCLAQAPPRPPDTKPEADNNLLSVTAGKEPPTPGSLKENAPTPGQPRTTFEADTDNFLSADGEIRGSGNVKVAYPGVTITADKVSGNLNREVTFTGHAKIVAKGITSFADTIQFYPRLSAYRLENPRATIDPSLLKGKVITPLYLYGGSIRGQRGGYTLADNTESTTCELPDPHYELRAASTEYIPDDKLIMKKVAVYFFGRKLIVIPLIVIPLKQINRRKQPDYLPEAGHNLNEGYYARFPYAFSEGEKAAGFLRLDATQLKGIGYRIEQEYLAGKQEKYFDTSAGRGGGGFNFTGGGGGAGNTFINATGYGSTGSLPRLGTGLGPVSGGLFAMQGYFSEGFSKDFSASFKHQQGIGSNNHIGMSLETQNSSYLSYSDQTSKNMRFNFAHQDTAHGVNGDLALNYVTNSSSTGYNTNQITGSLKQAFQFDSEGSTRNSFTYNLDYSNYASSNTFGATTTQNQTARLNTQIQFQHSSLDYSFGLQGNKSSPIGVQTGGGSFGTLERLPELTFSSDTSAYRGGWLHHLPLHLDLGYGQFSEPGSSIQTDRFLVAARLQEQSILKGHTEITAGGGFEQRFYGDGAAQYLLQETTRLRQHLGGRSGLDLSYQYQEPAGGTPFLFDTLSHIHFLSLEGGYMDDKRFQFTFRSGYDLLGTSHTRPWQSLSSRLMWRPNTHTRFDLLGTFDPNSGKFFAVTSSLKLRGAKDFALDLVSRYDPASGRFSQVNSQMDIPISKWWRVAGIVRYNGLSGRFDSQSFQVTRTWDCLEASLTYTNTPSGFQNPQQFYFSMRILAFPFTKQMGRGPAGDALGTGLGEIY